MASAAAWRNSEKRRSGSAVDTLLETRIPHLLFQARMVPPHLGNPGTGTGPAPDLSPQPTPTGSRGDARL
jgi:hypothetical protein